MVRLGLVVLVMFVMLFWLGLVVVMVVVLGLRVLGQVALRRMLDRTQVTNMRK